MHSQGIRTRLSVLLFVTTFLLSVPSAFSQVVGTSATAQHVDAVKKLSQINLPLSFESNQGQTDAQVKFLSRGPGYNLFLTQDEAVLALSKQSATDKEISRRQDVVRLKLEGANPNAVVAGDEKIAGKSNYYIGSDPKQW